MMTDRTRVSVSRVLVFACAFLFASVASALPHPMREGLVFDLGFVNPTTVSTPATKNDIKDFVRWSSATPLGFYGAGIGTCSAAQAELYGQPEPMIVTNLAMQSVLYTGQTNVTACLHLPQTTYRENGKNLVYPNGFITDHGVDAGSNLTYYIRFRWDGRTINTNVNIYGDNIFNNADRIGGYSLGIYVGSDSPKKVTRTGFVRVLGICDADFDHGFTVETNIWYDLAVSYKTTFRVNGSAVTTNLLLTGYLGSAGSRSINIRSKSFTGKMVRLQNTRDWRDHLFVGGLADNRTTGSGKLPDSYVPIGDHPVFRGDIACLQFYNRVIPQAEISALFGRADSLVFQTGVANGSADEFGKETDDLADVFETDEMEVRRLRKELTAEHPSLAIRYPVRPDEERQKKALELIPLLDGTPDGTTLRIVANGASVGTLALRNGQPCRLTLPRSATVRDADGKATVRLERTGDLSGTVCFDQILLGGSWCVGVRDKKSSDAGFANRTTLRSSAGNPVPSQIPGGNGGVRCLLDSLYGLNESKASFYYPTESLVFFLPPTVASSCASELTIALTTGASTFREIALYANGVEKFRQKGWPASYPVFTVPFQPGELQSGFNELIISNATCDFTAVPGSSNYFTLFFDQVKFEPKLPTGGGFAIIVK